MSDEKFEYNPSTGVAQWKSDGPDGICLGALGDPLSYCEGKTADLGRTSAYYKKNFVGPGRPPVDYKGEFAKLVAVGNMKQIQKYWREVIIRRVPYEDRKEINTAALSEAISLNNVGVACWTYSLFPAPQLTKKEWRNALKEACAETRLEMAQWIWARNGDATIVWALFEIACYSGHLKTAQWLWGILPNKAAHAEGLAILFSYACGNGDQELVEWMWVLGVINKLKSINEHGLSALRMAACGGYLSIMLWLKANGFNTGSSLIKGREVFLATCKGWNPERPDNLECINFAWNECKFDRLEAVSAALLTSPDGPVADWLERTYALLENSQEEIQYCENPSCYELAKGGLCPLH